VARCEGAAVLAERSATSPTQALALAPDTLQAMARVAARDAAHRVALDGARWAIGAGQSDPALVDTLNVAGAAQAQAGLLQDMDIVARQLIEAFPL
jgi:hypothetical protein